MDASEPAESKFKETLSPETLAKIESACSPEAYKVFEQLLPSYQEHIEHKNEGVEEPIVHGTGSYALRRILTQGFIPQQGDQILAGESTNRYKVKSVEKPNPVSFAKWDKSSEDVSHWFATLPCTREGRRLAFDSTEVLGDRFQRIADEVYGGVNNAVQRQMEVRGLTAILGEKRTEAENQIRKRIEFNYADRSQEAANVINPDKMVEKIESIKALFEGESDSETLFEVLMGIDVLDPWMKDHRFEIYQTEEALQVISEDLKNPNGEVSRRLELSIQQYLNTLEAYNALPQAEKDELAGQFPCYFVVEGKDQKLASTHWMAPYVTEVHSKHGIPPSAIREIQVPLEKVAEVEEWVKNARLSGVKVVPLEYFEMELVIEAVS